MLDPDITPEATSEGHEAFEGRDGNGATRWAGGRLDPILGSNSQPRAIADVYACADAPAIFVRDFVVVWTKVLNLDRSDVAAR